MTKPTKWLCTKSDQSSLCTQWVAKLSSCGQRRLFRLGGCPGWSESSLGARAILLVLSWGSSNIGIFNGCEMRFENSIRRVTVWCHEACQKVPSSYFKWQNFQFARNNHYGFFFLLTLSWTIRFKFKFCITSSHLYYRKFPKYSDTPKICCNDSKIWTMWLYHRVMSPNNKTEWQTV